MLDYQKISQDSKNSQKSDYDKVFETVKSDKVKIVTNADVDKNAQGDPNTKVLKDTFTNIKVTYDK